MEEVGTCGQVAMLPAWTRRLPWDYWKIHLWDFLLQSSPCCSFGFSSCSCPGWAEGGCRRVCSSFIFFVSKYLGTHISKTPRYSILNIDVSDTQWVFSLTGSTPVRSAPPWTDTPSSLAKIHVWQHRWDLLELRPGQSTVDISRVYRANFNIWVLSPVSRYVLIFFLLAFSEYYIVRRNTVNS